MGSTDLIKEIRGGLEGTTAGPLRYEIQYGPEGEAYYAWLYRGNTMLTTIKTHDAISIVNAVNSIPTLLSRLETAERERDEARADHRMVTELYNTALSDYGDAAEALSNIARMRILPDDKANSFKLVAAIQIATRALAKEQTNG